MTKWGIEITPREKDRVRSLRRLSAMTTVKIPEIRVFLLGALSTHIS